MVRMAQVEYRPALATVATSSPARTPAARRASSSASVPFATETQSATPHHCANSRSKAWVSGPRRSQPRRRTRSTAASGAGRRERSLKGTVMSASRISIARVKSPALFPCGSSLPTGLPEDQTEAAGQEGPSAGFGDDAIVGLDAGAVERQVPAVGVDAAIEGQGVRSTGCAEGGGGGAAYDDIAPKGH